MLPSSPALAWLFVTLIISFLHAGTCQNVTVVNSASVYDEAACVTAMGQGIAAIFER